MAGKGGRQVRLNSDTGLLKLIAIAAMLVDHLGARVFPQYEIMRVIGRIAFPVFAYCIAAGCVYTRNIAKYALRVLLLAIVVQPLYVTAMGHQQMMAFDWKANFLRFDLIFKHYYAPRPSILFSLFLGILMIWSIRDRRYIATAALTAVCWYASGQLDYGINGIILMVLFYVFIDRPLTSLTWVAAFMVWWGVPALRNRFEPWAITRVTVQFYALLSLPLIYIPMHTGIKVNKYVFYLFYPAHLALIYALTMA